MELMLEMREAIYQQLLMTRDDNPSLLKLWDRSFIENDNTLVLPWDHATRIAESAPGGYHTGVWRLATEYERMVAMGMLTNANSNAPGHGQPKSFSAWPRRHNVDLYRQASSLRDALSPDLWKVTPADHFHYVNLIDRWHQSTTYIGHITGDTRLNKHQLQQILVAFSMFTWSVLRHPAS